MLNLLKNSLLILLCALLLTVPISAADNIKSIKYNSKLKIGGEMDNNIGEDSNQKISGKAMKLLSQFEALGAFNHNTVYSISSNIGGRMYSVYSNENRFIGNLKSSLSRRLNNLVVLGVNGLFYYDDYKEGVRDNNSYLAEGFIHIPRQAAAFCDIDLSYQYFNSAYKNDSFFNFFESKYFLSLKKDINIRTTVTTFSRFSNRHYQRRAYNNGTDVKNEFQRDLSQEIGIGIKYFRTFFIQTFYIYRHNISNSYGFSFIENRLNIIIGKKLSQNYMLKFYGDIESKKYKDTGDFLIIIDINEDKEKDNRAIVELSRNVNENVDLDIRLEWSKNESRVRKLYYSKFLISTGLSYKF